VRRVLDTLDFCHGRDVVHRDIKPSNVVLREGRHDAPVLLDFGLSFTRDFPADAPAPSAAPAPSEAAAAPQASNGGRFIVLPEDFSRGADRRNDVSDVTQCTGLLFYLLTGQSPGHLMDDRGRRPHEQERALRVLHRLGLPSADPLFRLFDVGFAEDPDKRWQSAGSLSEQIDRLLEPTPIATPDYVTARARQIRKRIGDNPEISGQVAAEKFAGDIVTVVSNTMNVLNTELGDVLTVGLVLSRPRPGFKKIAMIFTEKMNPKRRFECSLATVLENQQLLVIAECLGRTGEVVRVGLNDPDATEVLRKAVETFLLDTADHFTDGQV
jgi:serine/threonine-protein kinase